MEVVVDVMPRREAQHPAKGSGRVRRYQTLGVAAALSVSMLSGCGGGSETINWLVTPGSIGAHERIAEECEKSSNGAYKINIVPLPFTPEGQRGVIVRLLREHNSSMDVATLDPPFNVELANAGWLQPFTERQKSALLDGVLRAPIEAAMWQGKLYGAPWTANTQLLWYKKSVARAAGVDPTQDTFTWDEMLDAALKTGTTIAPQGDKYEGLTVWVNAIVLGAGGQILQDTDRGRNATVAINSAEGREAAALIRKVAISKAAPPNLSASREIEALASFEQPGGGFMVNWPFVYSALLTDVQEGRKPASFMDDLAWARYPRVRADEPSKPPLGGFNLVISKFSEQKNIAYQFVQCAVSPASEKMNLLLDGSPAANATVYDDPEVKKAIPMAALMRESINAGGPRPVTPFYADISAAIQQSWYPPTAIQPATTPKESAELIGHVLRNATTVAKR
jgi:multiple sugar transport system substrate-binding protein